MRVSALVTLLVAVLVASVASRALLAEDAGSKPPECSGWRQDWSDKEIKCRGCDGTLKCEVEHGHIRTRRLECDFDKGVLHRAVDWECKLNDAGKQYVCDWDNLKTKLPTCAYDMTVKLLSNWVPRT